MRQIEHIIALAFHQQVRHQFPGQVFQPETVRHRHLKRTRAPAKGLDFFLNFLSQIVARMIIESHVRAFASKNLTNCLTDSARPACDHCNASHWIISQIFFSVPSAITA